MSTKPASVALLGGPDSGKTTFLGAIARALEDRGLSRLVLSTNPRDKRALRKLQERLLANTYPDRTKAERLTLDVDLSYQHPDLGTQNLKLRAADYDGEEVERLFRYRNSGWSPEWQARADSNGLLLFLKPESLTRVPLAAAELLSEMQQWERLRDTAGASAARSTAPANPDPVEFIFGPGLSAQEAPETRRQHSTEKVRVPTQIALVELLQFIRHVRGWAPGQRPPTEALRIAVVVAAWDSVSQEWRDKGPAHWMAEHMPLLEDFLWSNFHCEAVYRFGLSATGGDLNDPVYREKYGDEPNFWVEWNGPTGAVVPRPKGLTLPLEWALFGDRALADEEPSGDV